MRLCCAVLALLILAGCGASEQPPAASVSAAASAVASASVVVAQPSASAAAPTLVPLASAPAASSEPSPQPSAPPASVAASAQPSTAPAPPLARTLQLAEPPLEGDDVRQLQQRLADLGYTQVGAADGIFGPNTAAAVRTFQLANGLEEDGIVGPRTWEQLFGAAVQAQAIVPVLALPTGWLLGGSADGRWLDVAPVAALLRGGEQYRIPGSETSYSGNVPPPPEVPCETAYAVTLSPQPASDFSIAVGGDFELQPRPVSEEDLAQDTYRDQVAAFLVAEGIAEPDVQIQRVLRADLDGDGNDEVLINATRLGDPSTGALTPDAAAGDYSLVLLLRQGQATAVNIESNVYPEPEDFVAPQRFLLIGAYDLNGDGRMEVVIDGAYYEGAYISVYEMQGEQPEIVLGNGCGV